MERDERCCEWERVCDGVSSHGELRLEADEEADDDDRGWETREEPSIAQFETPSNENPSNFNSTSGNGQVSWVT
jgi:hypothetical protein